MNTIRISTTQNIDLEFELASLGERMVGYLIDVGILLAYSFVCLFLLVLNRGLMYKMEWLGYIFSIPVVFYDLVSEVLMNGQSVGKKVMHIKVISLNGEKASLGQYLIRWIFRLVDFSLTSNLCALIAIAVSERNQRIGDMVAGTTLIRTTPRATFQKTIYTPVVPENYQVTFPQVASLDAKDVQLIKEIILNVNQSGNMLVAQQAAEKIQQNLNIQTGIAPKAFLVTLLSDYNFLMSQG